VRGEVSGSSEPAASSATLRRHGLVWLRPGAWDGLLRAHASSSSADAPSSGNLGSPDAPDAPDADRDAAADVRACLGAWAAHDWPLVVARQDAAAPGRIALGLPAPARWGRRRIALQVAAGGIARRGRFAAPEAVLPLLPDGARDGWRRLAGALRALAVPAGVYGSYGWQALTGLDYLHAGSDIDLCLPVRDAPQADRVADRLEAFCSGTPPRLDGELMLPGGAAVAWREWRRWRAGGMAGAVLVKRLDGAALVRGGGWLATETGTGTDAGDDGAADARRDAGAGA